MTVSLSAILNNDLIDRASKHPAILVRPVSGPQSNLCGGARVLNTPLVLAHPIA